MGRIRFYATNADRQKAYRKRCKIRMRKEHLRHNVSDPLRDAALERFQADRTKCFQRHIREVLAEHDPRPALLNLTNAAVTQINNRLAARIILRFEWLGTMPQAAAFSYGLWPSFAYHHKPEDLLGAVVFTKGGNTRALASIAPYGNAMILARGACVMRAGRNAASFLISRACKLAARDHGITHFLAYSDPEAGERGTIYKALNWQYLGETTGGRKGRHLGFVSPDGERVSSYQINRRASFEARFYRMGWDGRQSKYGFLRGLGWKEAMEPAKLRWMHAVKIKPQARGMR
jgi:hypothetical protein